MVAFLFGRVEPEGKAARVVDESKEYLKEAAAALDQVGDWTTPAIESALRSLAEERGLKPKQAFQPVRAAVTGTLVSPPLFESLEILGRDETLERLRAAA
jgi:glutamyl-tRNA synthetase